MTQDDASTEPTQTLVVQASIASIDEGRAVLDAELGAIKLPLAMLPGEPAEGAAYVITIAVAAQTKSALAQSVQARLDALMAKPTNK
jgi:hypothetical protein